MKNLICSLIFISALLLANQLKAQTIPQNNHPFTSTNLTTSNEVEIITDFKATKQQKKIIRKVKKYVTVRFLGRRKNTEGLIGKTVKVQLTINHDGTLKAISIIRGQGPKINQRIVDLIEKYDKKKPIAASKIEKPAVIQLTIPLVRKKYFLD